MSADSSECTACSAGKYSAVVGATVACVCTSCALGKYSQNDGATAELDFVDVAPAALDAPLDVQIIIWSSVGGALFVVLVAFLFYQYCYKNKGGDEDNTKVSVDEEEHTQIELGTTNPVVQSQREEREAHVLLENNNEEEEHTQTQIEHGTINCIHPSVSDESDG